MAKNYLLSTDFARLAAIARGDKRDKAIEQYITSNPHLSYQALRSVLPEITRERGDLGLSVKEATWPQIEDKILLKCGNKKLDREYNPLKGKALFDYFRSKDIFSQRKYDMHIGMKNPSEGYTKFWDDMYLVENNTVFLPFFDLRSKGTCLSADAREIVFSVQDWLLRQMDPQLEQAELIVIGIEGTKASGFTAIPHIHSGEIRWSPEDLQAMMFEVYADWVRVATGLPNRRTGTYDNDGFDFG